MPDALSRQRGFSLPETLLALVLLIVTVTALAGYQRGLASSSMQLTQYRQLWRDAWRFGQLSPPAIAGATRYPVCRHRCKDVSASR